MVLLLYLKCCFFFNVEKGRFPKFEVRKINQALSDETVPADPFSHDFGDVKNGSLSEDNLQMRDEIPAQIQYVSKSAQVMGESSCEDVTSVRLFLYGVFITLSVSCPENMLA